MIIVGIDPHKSTHTAAALDTATGEHLGEVTVQADRSGYARLGRWLKNIAPAAVAVENACGLGRHLSEWLVGEALTVVDVPTKTVRAQRLAHRGGTNKNDTADALAAALAAAAGAGYPLDTDQDGRVADLLADEREQLRAEAAAKRNRLHAHLRILRPGGMPTGIGLGGIANLLKGVRPATPAAVEHKRQARWLLGELRRIDKALKENEQRMTELAGTIGTTLTGIDGIGAVSAVTIIGAVGSIDRFASHDALAAFAGAAPRQIASGSKDRHRLNRNGDRRLRFALHWAALTQSRMKHSPGRVYYLRKREEGKTHREALRCLKRQLVRLIWRTMKGDAEYRTQVTLAA